MASEKWTPKGMRMGSEVAVRNRRRAYRWIILCCAIPLLLCLLGAWSGIRLSSIQAARAHFAVPDDAILVEEVDLSWGKVLLFEGADTFCAVGSYRTAGLWRAPASSGGPIRSEDAVQTLACFGWALSIDRQVTVLAVRSFDPRVVAIEVGGEEHGAYLPVTLGELTVFEWHEVGVFTEKPYAVALDSEGRVLYEYRYRLPNILADDELRWYPVDTVARAD